MAMDEGLAEMVRNVIVASPYGRLLGVQLNRLEPDHVVVTLPFRPEITTVASIVHGGAIAGLIDLVAAATVWSNVDPGVKPRGVTVGMSLSYLAAADGSDLVAEGTMLRRGRSLSVGEVVVRDAKKALVAKATITYKLG